MKLEQYTQRYVFVMTLLLGLLLASTAAAHPLGNSSVNRQAGLHLSPDRLELRYLLDMAEIPTLAETLAADVNGDGETTPAEWDVYTERWASALPSDLSVTLDGKPLPLELRSQSWNLALGAAALNTLRLEAHLGASLDAVGKGALLQYRDLDKPGQFGWKEIWISTKGGVNIGRTEAARTDRSRGLTDYTLSFGSQPPNELSAQATVDFPPTAKSPDSLLAPTAAATGQSDAGAIASSEALNQGQVARPILFKQQVWPFFKLGIHHIATGLDHLVFLLGLLLLSQTLTQLIKVVTAFTVAHSITLALAAKGWVMPPSILVEPAIALTIAYVGLLALVWQHTRHSVWLALGFGLVHGFGFAGALAGSLPQQPAGQWLVSLASFNLGIEVFQVLLVCLIVPLIRFAGRFAWFEGARQVASLSVLGAGLGWFFTRTIGIL